MNRFRLSAFTLLLCATGAVFAQSTQPLTSVSSFRVAPGKTATFINRAKAFAPVLDKLMESGAVLSYGVDVDMLHVPGDNNVAMWAEVPDFAALGALESALNDFAKANPAVMGDIFSLSDPATHHDLIVRSLEGKTGPVPAGATPTVDFDLISVKEGQMHQYLELFRKYEKPVLDNLVSSGVIYGYSLDTEAVHTMKPGMVWTILTMPGLGAKDKARAAFQAADKALSETERAQMEKAYQDLVEPGSHRDSLATSVLFKQK